jgi:phosphoketolase
MNGVDRFQLAIEALSRADTAISETVRSMSGQFAIRSIPGAREAIDAFSKRLAELRARTRELGDDPPEIKNWAWPRDGLSAAPGARA